MTRSEFRRHAEALTAQIIGQGVAVLVKPREGATALGWKGRREGFVLVKGRQLRVTVTVTVTPAGSADWPEEQS